MVTKEEIYEQLGLLPAHEYREARLKKNRSNPDFPYAHDYNRQTGRTTEIIVNALSVMRRRDIKILWCSHQQYRRREFMRHMARGYIETLGWSDICIVIPPPSHEPVGCDSVMCEDHA